MNVFLDVRSGAIAVSLSLIFLTLTPVVSAPQISTKGTVVFTFDDGRDGQRTFAADILKTYDMSATAFEYVTSLTRGRGFMSLSQLTELKDSYGWEIADHTYTHPHLDSMTGHQLQREIVDSKTEFAKLGFNVTTFAYPFSEGNRNREVTQLVRQNYLGARSASTSQKANLYDGSSDVYNIVANDVANTTTPAIVKKWIDQAVSERKLLVLSFHQIVVDKPVFDTFYRADELDAIAGYVHGKVAAGNLEVVTFRQAIDNMTKAAPANVAFLATVGSAFLLIIGAVIGGLLGSVVLMRRRGFSSSTPIPRVVAATFSMFPPRR